MKTIEAFLILLIFVSCKQTENKTSQTSTFSNLEIKTYPQTELEADFDLLVNSLKEAHTGLYWYSSEKQFDNVVAIQRALLDDNLNALQFYNIVAPIVAFTKEDHCDISLSEDLDKAIADRGLFIPLIVINLKQKPLILNPPYKGFELLSINEMAIDAVYRKIFNTFASDGFIESSKYRYLDLRGFSREYAKVIDQKSEYEITVKNPVNGETKTSKVQSISYAKLKKFTKQVLNENNIRTEIDKPAKLQFPENNTAILTSSTFGNDDFEEFDMNFKTFIDSAFSEIQKRNVTDLIIDIRDNGGGSEGNEDYLFSYLTDKPYKKYKHVELSRFSFSFLDFTDYSSIEDKTELLDELKKENEASQSGRIYRRSDIYIQEPLKKNSYKGNIYVLISGWTYSGGSEFSTLMKEHTKAIFIGEETGGGYFGNTSGTSLELTLPVTKLKIDIPILKFVLDVNKGQFGRGVIPNFEIEPTFEEFINGYDTEMEYAKKLVSEKKLLNQ